MPSRLSARLVFLRFCVLAVFGAFAGPAGATPALFKLSSAPATAVLTTAADPSESAVVARRGVEVDAALLEGARPGDPLGFDLPGEPGVEGIVREVHTNARGARVYSGTISQPEGASFLIVARDDEIVGNVVLFPTIYQLRRVASGEGREIRRIDPRALHPCGAREPGSSVRIATHVPDRAVKADASPLADDGTQYDLMIVYTPAARAAAGGTQAIETLADLAVEDTNNVYANSRVTIRARLVHTEEVAYTESGSVHTDVNRLRDPVDGYLDGVLAVRDQHNADLVSLWVKNATDFGGYGVYNYNLAAGGTKTLDGSGGFTALIYSEASPNLLAHEIGHNFGCAHDHQNASGDIFYPYGYGWRFTGSDGVLYRTIMAYDPGSWVPYFSSPSLFYKGTATGVADAEDNARAMNASALWVANFRVSAQATPTGLAPFFRGNVPVGSGFYSLDFFGYYAPYQFPYLYHNELQFLYALDAANADRGVYFYDFQGLGFLYTSPALYPYLYSFDQGAFLYYFKGTTRPRVFVNLSTQQFISR